jgi:hypothetical protein
VILTPSISITEEFNDNVFQNNDNKEYDFITQFTPGIRLDIRQPGFELGAGYNFTAEIYARNDELNNAANRQRFFTDLYYQATPNLRLSLSDSLNYDRNSNAASIAGVSTGRTEAWSNVFAPALEYTITPRLTSRLYGAYELQRFGGAGSQDSDVYRAGVGLDYAVTPRFNVTTGYDFAYLDIDLEPTATTHTPRFGFTYQITPTLTAALSGGPSFLVSSRDTTVTPAVSASLTQLARWGSMSLLYDRAIRTSGGFGGPADNQTFAGNISVTTLARGLSIGFSPRYTISEAEDIARNDTEVKALTLNLSASYQIARYVSVVGAYTFFNQRTDNDPRAVDVDQNRVFLGLQFGYPISFD